MEKKIMYNVLLEIRKGGSGGSAAPDSGYLKGLEAIGAIKTGWDNSLTEFGGWLLDQLSYSIEKW